jgi:adenosylhomocysteine nucleosidase
MTTPKLPSSACHVLILGAMQQEIEAWLSRIEPRDTECWNGYELHWGTIEDTPVVVTRSGVGKVFASLITQHLIDRGPLRAVLFTGVAGAVAPDLEAGDLIIGERLVHHDLDVTRLGFAIGHIPFTDYRFFEAHPPFVAAALRTLLTEGKLRTGCIGTGDQFITDKSGLPAIGLDCVDMEGAAVAQVCTINQVPFLVVRIISDKADGSATHDFLHNLPRFAHRSADILQAVLQSMR